MTSGSNNPVTMQGAPIVISVDAMGGDKGPAAVVAGVCASLREHPDMHVLLHGNENEVAPLLAQSGLEGRITLRHAEGVVTMDDKPSQVMRHGQKTSMWATIDAVREGAAGAAVSCGNTGALMAVSMIRLRKLPGVNRPAIACLWPSRNAGGYNVMLDVGADVKADPSDLLQYAVMGAAYAHTGLGLARPRAGLLNVGTEEHKGRAELKEAHELLTHQAPAMGFDYVGFVEGVDIPGNRTDVIVTDGFTGNIALKTGEGTAKLLSDFMKESFKSSILSKIGALLSMGALKSLQKRMDPRRVNGGVFLGLRGTVIKSHGSSDGTAIAAAIGLAYRLASAKLTEGIAARLASTAPSGQDAANGTSGTIAGNGSQSSE